MAGNKKSRRKFIKESMTGAAALSVGGVLSGFSPQSYKKIIGANERLRAGVMGVNARGNALATNFALEPNCEVVYISDVDCRAEVKRFEEGSNTKDYNPEE